MMLGEYNYSHLLKGELLCAPFNECTTLSLSMNSHTTSLLPKKQISYAYKYVRVIVL